MAKKEKGINIRLIFALPCPDQDKFWNAEQRTLYRNLLKEADEIAFISSEYYDGCMQKRNQYMADQSEYCICALLYKSGGTEKTVRYARQKKLEIINIM